MLRCDVPITKVVIVAGRTDMRLGQDSLVTAVRLNYGTDPIEKGTVFLFCGIKKDRIKALQYEGDSFCLLTKRLVYSDDLEQAAR